MQRFSSLTLEKTKVFDSSKLIELALLQTEYYWLNKVELENVVIEIENNILTIKDGVFYHGDILFAVIDGGTFKDITLHSGIVNIQNFKGKILDAIVNGE